MGVQGWRWKNWQDHQNDHRLNMEMSPDKPPEVGRMHNDDVSMRQTIGDRPIGRQQQAGKKVGRQQCRAATDQL
jgi:hypothetical protein